jgi:hypothetical protein
MYVPQLRRQSHGLTPYLGKLGNMNELHAQEGKE